MNPTPSTITTCSTVQIYEAIYRVGAVDEPTAELLSTTNHVNLDVQEARHLHRSKLTVLSASECSWMYSVIQNTEAALHAIAQLIEPARIDGTTKTNPAVSGTTIWGLRANPKVRDKHRRLSLCHQSLTAVITCLYAKEVGLSSPMIEARCDDQSPPVYEPRIEDLLKWQNKRKWRKGLAKYVKEDDLSTLAGTISSSASALSVPQNDGHPPFLPELDDMPCSSSTYKLEHQLVERFTNASPAEQILGPCNHTDNMFKEIPESTENKPVLDYYSRLNSSNIVGVDDIDLMQDYIKNTSSISNIDGLPAQSRIPKQASCPEAHGSHVTNSCGFESQSVLPSPLIRSESSSTFASPHFFCHTESASSAPELCYTQPTPAHTNSVSAKHHGRSYINIDVAAVDTMPRPNAFGSMVNNQRPGQYTAYHPSIQDKANSLRLTEDLIPLNRVSVRRRKWNWLTDQEANFATDNG